jgi:hypothetical protein
MSDGNVFDSFYSGTTAETDVFATNVNTARVTGDLTVDGTAHFNTVEVLPVATKKRRLLGTDDAALVQAVDTVTPLDYAFGTSQLRIIPSSVSGQVLETVGSDVKWTDLPAQTSITTASPLAPQSGATGAVTVAFESGTTNTRVLTEVNGGQPSFQAPVPRTTITTAAPFASQSGASGAVTVAFPPGSTNTRVLTEVNGGQPVWQALPADTITSVAAAASPNGIIVTPTTGDVKVGLSTSSDVEVKTLTVRPTGTDNGLNIISTVPAPFIGLTWNGVRQCYMGVPFAGAGAGGTFSSEVGPIVLAVPAAKQVIARVNGKDILAAGEYDLGLTTSQTLYSSTAQMITSYYQSGIRQGYLGSRANASSAGIAIICEQNDMVQSFPSGRKIVFQENYADRMTVDGTGLKFEQAGMKNGVLVSDANGRVSASTTSDINVGSLSASTSVKIGPSGGWPLGMVKIVDDTISATNGQFSLQWWQIPIPAGFNHIKINLTTTLGPASTSINNWYRLRCFNTVGAVQTGVHYSGGFFQTLTSGDTNSAKGSATSFDTFWFGGNFVNQDPVAGEITILNWKDSSLPKKIIRLDSAGCGGQWRSYVQYENSSNPNIGGLYLTVLDSLSQTVNGRYTIYAF